ncbi:exodeoxyribonuclease VII small subunit [Desulfohalotomaculum tongense]|uniref:exodeoxyribonuclease VII small subunit n=1 Tax=Desulforadius tongensis TaxID=1216062 RepID=UPI00195A1706|nr:exodeoxyribonuclease VII small subunit [Desulforadius tongensis]
MQLKEMNFEDALFRLEEVVKKLEDGQLPLEQALELFAEGIELANVCNKKLEAAEQRINTLVTNQCGEPVLEEAPGYGGGQF